MQANYRQFEVGQKVSARCSEGVAYRGKVTAQNDDLVRIHFNDGDNCDVRRCDVRHQLHINDERTLHFPSLVCPKPVNCEPRPTNCVHCGKAVISSKLPQFIIKKNEAAPNSQVTLRDVKILTCFMCGDSYHKECFSGTILEHDMTIYCKNGKITISTHDEMVLLGWKCRFCVIQVYTEVAWGAESGEPNVVPVDIPQNWRSL